MEPLPSIPRICSEDGAMYRLMHFSGRLLQRIEICLVWLAGTALPLLIAWALFGRVISGWQFPWLVWLGVTISCKAMQEIVRLFERVLVEDFA